MTRLLLVRHGESDWNATRRLQGQADIALSDRGLRQAEALRPVIEAIDPRRTIASDLRRVRQTAAALGIDRPRLIEELREIDVGAWTGRSIPDIVKADPEAYRAWRAGTHTPPDGEEWGCFSRRVTGAVRTDMETTPCEVLLAVVHGAVIRALLEHFLQLPPSRIVPVAPASLTALRLPVGNGAGARLELFNYRPDGPVFDAPD